MPTTPDPGAVLVAHLKWIEKVAEITCRRNSVWGDDAEEFASLAKMKLVENDYAALRKFRGECDIKTFLATVVVRRFHEYAREQWGRWRHSARAEQLGHPAKDLEALVYRDGYTLDQAIEVLRTSGKTDVSPGELTRLFAELPHRQSRPASAGSDPLDSLPASTRADEQVVREEAEERCSAVRKVLSHVLARLDPEDQVLVRGRFGEGRSVADIARMLKLDQAPLYRRSDRLRKELRRRMEEAGVRREDVLECLALHEL